MIRVPTRSRREDIETPHPLCQRRPQTRKSSNQHPLSLVTHRRDSPAKGRKRHRKAPTTLSSAPDEQMQDLPSPKELMIDESESPKKVMISDGERSEDEQNTSHSQKRFKAEESASSCRVPVIVRREAYPKQDGNRSEVDNRKKPHQRMPHVTELLKKESVIRSEKGLKHFHAKPLPHCERLSANATPEAKEDDAEGDSNEMPVLKPSPVAARRETDQDNATPKQMPTLELSASSSSSSSSSASSSPQQGSCPSVTAPSQYSHNREYNSIDDDPPSPILEMSDEDDDEDEPVMDTTSSSSPKQTHEPDVKDDAIDDGDDVDDDGSGDRGRAKNSHKDDKDIE